MPPHEVNGTAPPLTPFALTNEIRAQVVARTGQDIGPDDPALLWIALIEIALPKIAGECASLLKEGNQAAGVQLAAMKAETLQAAAAELTRTADKVRQDLRLDLRDAEARASQIVAGIENSVKLSRAVWLGAGAIIVGIFFIGLLVGSALGRG